MDISNLGGTNQAARRAKKAVAAIAVTAALLLLPASALAQQISPANDQYDPKTSIVSEGPGDSGPSSTDRLSGDLPFSGLDVALLIGAAGLLAASGLVLRRVSTNERR